VPYLSPAPDAPEPTETAVVVLVGAAEPVVGEHREHLDWAAARGVPAHVTVLYPFVHPAGVTEDLVTTLTAATGSVPAFDCRFARTRWFGDDVVWLDPEPAGPFRQLTAAVSAAFPEHPPYRGVYADVVPHLTVGEKHLADVEALETAERAVLPRLPILTHVDRAVLIAGSEALLSWRVLHELPLAPPTPGSAAG
jgi:2'-5' RNA ligase